jgi:autophagy-related protein 16
MWKAALLEQLRLRDAAVAPVLPVIRSYSLQLRQLRELRALLLNSAGARQGTLIDGDQVHGLKEELASSYRLQSRQAQQVIDLMKTTSALEAEVASLTARGMAAAAEQQKLLEERKAAEDRAAAASATVGALQAELQQAKRDKDELHAALEASGARETATGKEAFAQRQRVVEYRLELQQAMELINRLNDETALLMARLAARPEPAQRGNSSAGASEPLLAVAALACKKPTAVRRTIEAHGEAVNGATYDLAGRVFATAGADGMLRTWDSAAGNPLRSYRGPSKPALAVRFSLSGDVLFAGASDSCCWMWDVKSEKILGQLTGHTDKVPGLDVASERLISGSWDRWIKVWDIARGSCVQTLAGESKVNAVRYMKGFTAAASGHLDKHVRLHDLASAQCVARLALHTASVTSLFIPESEPHLLLTASRDNTLALSDLRFLAEAKPLQTFSDPRYRSGCEWAGACMSPDGAYVAAGGADGHVLLWNVRTGKAEAALRSLRSPVSQVAWRPDGAQLLVSHLERNVQLWE